MERGGEEGREIEVKVVRWEGGEASMLWRVV